MTATVIVNQNTAGRNDHPALISRIAAALVAVLAALAFILSYSSLQHLAEINHVGPRLSYAWPLLLDFAMVVFSLAILRANLRQERAAYPWLLTVAFAALATVANVLDVTALGLPPVAIAAAVKALAPVALVLAFELLMGMIRAEIRRADVVRSITELTGQAAHLAADLNAHRQDAAAELAQLDRTTEAARARLEAIRADLNREISSKRAASVSELNAARAAKVAERRARVLELLPQYSNRQDLAAALGVSVKTIRQDIRALNGRAVAAVGGE